MKKPQEKKRYNAPKVDTVSVRELHEAVGPAQGFASGVLAASTTKKVKTRGRGHGHGRGHR